MEFQLARSAKGDLFEITDYYSAISPDLAEGFVQELNSSLLLLCRNPGMGSRRFAHFLPDQSLRVWRHDRFPFLIFYRADSINVTVHRILHERRDISAGMITL